MLADNDAFLDELADVLVYGGH